MYRIRSTSKIRVRNGLTSYILPSGIYPAGITSEVSGLRSIRRLGATVIAVLLVLFGLANAAYAAPSVPKQASKTRIVNTHIPSGLGSAASETGTHSNKGVTAQAEIPINCEDSVTAANGAVTYDDQSPAELASISWTGGAIADCTGPMVGISYSLSAVDPQGISHIIAEGSCGACTGVDAVNTGYTCSQGTDESDNCAGAWQISNEIIYEGEPGSVWEGASPNCEADGPILTCSASAYDGTAPLFALDESACSTSTQNAAAETLSTPSSAEEGCYNVPPSGAIPLLTQKAIADIETYHVEGGPQAKDDKGQFYAGTTPNELQTIWEKGMNDPGPWTLNEKGYYQKTFDCPAVGIQSPLYGKSELNKQVTLVVEAQNAGGYSQVVTMYPETEDDD